jgi:hypothetical protein
LKEKALAWSQPLLHCITTLEKCTTFFVQKFTSFGNMMQVVKSLSDFTHKIGEIFAQPWGRFCGLIKSAPDHGYLSMLYTIIYPLEEKEQSRGMLLLSPEVMEEARDNMNNHGFHVA